MLLIFSFPPELKIADVGPVFQKKDPLKAEKCRPVSVLPVVYKTFERFLHKKLTCMLSISCHTMYVVIEKDPVHSNYSYHFKEMENLIR